MHQQRRDRPRPWLFLVGTAAGVGVAFLALLADPLFFVTVPVWAFALGYLSTSRISGLLVSLLVVVNYLIAFGMLASLGEEDALNPYVANVMLSGLFYPLVGYGAPYVRRHPKGWVAAATIGLTVLLVLWAAFLVAPSVWS
jgi:hypothetical protein